MYCNNCGAKGHLYKDCRLPITSCGNIVIRLDGSEPKVLMIQRKDSLCYIDLIRGKYDINNKIYLQTLVNKCSNEEKQNLLNKEFVLLWKDLWLLPEDYTMTDDYLRSYKKFNDIKNDNVYNFKYFIENSDTNYECSEWEFPKGRRNMNENNFNCAKREFQEETSYESNDYNIINNIYPFTESFIGENKVRYKYIYYIGILKNFNKKPVIDSNNKQQIGEIKNIQWLTIDECFKIIRDYHKSRRNLIGQIQNFINIINDKKYSLI